MKVTSNERSTGMGAIQFTAVLVDGEWVRVSAMPGHKSHGCSQGVYEYSVEVADGTPTAHFYRSNSGKERVTITDADGKEIGCRLFDDADEWAWNHLPQSVIVTRHAPTVEWLRREVLELADAPVVEMASPDDVRGKVVYGNLPLSLACLAQKIVAVEFTGDPPRGREYGVGEMDAAGARLTTYRVIRVIAE